ncbi:component of SufBCD complex [Tropicibacter sp. R16_0]|uniref:component of SufBCD complex n=1 Tax=Tropicibacter sp. R16_0 TaxID=2821102 RepID=UPI001ADC1EBB|nr:component of SufBCD complex [Tropicibacter sp. R16_0]MBO9449801.1 component of SufBCD complex [Tropicibacter sp. R16_0]
MAGNEMDAHATLNELRYPRADWGLRVGATLAFILCILSFVVLLSGENALAVGAFGVAALLIGSLATGAIVGFAIQKWIMAKADHEAEEMRELQRSEADRQMRAFKEANE